MKRKSDFERFIRKVKIDPLTECWNWVGALQGSSKTHKYPAFYFAGKLGSGHIWSHLHFKGPIPINKKCCHSCDNTHCVNPKHLFIGSQKDNMNDASSKNRLFSWKKRGDKCPAIVGILINGKYKLSMNDVLNIRKSFSQGKEKKLLATTYHVHITTINRILSNRSWNFI